MLITICPPLINIFSCLLYINGVNLYGVQHCRALFYWIYSSLESWQVETVCLSWNCLTKVLYWWLRSDVNSHDIMSSLLAHLRKLGPLRRRYRPYGGHERERDWTWTQHCYPTLALTKVRGSNPFDMKKNMLLASGMHLYGAWQGLIKMLRHKVTLGWVLLLKR